MTLGELKAKLQNQIKNKGQTRDEYIRICENNKEDSYYPYYIMQCINEINIYHLVLAWVEDTSPESLRDELLQLGYTAIKGYQADEFNLDHLEAAEEYIKRIDETYWSEE